jgi:hypothetical protein
VKRAAITLTQREGLRDLVASRSERYVFFYSTQLKLPLVGGFCRVWSMA